MRCAFIDLRTYIAKLFFRYMYLPLANQIVAELRLKYENHITIEIIKFSQMYMYPSQ